MASETTATIVMNNPCLTETSSYSSWASRPVAARLETTRGDLCGSSSMDQTSPLRQPRLFEARQRVLLRIVHLEHQRKLGNHEDVLNLLVHRAELHLGPALGVVRMSADQDAEGDAVHERRLPQVDQELLVSRFGQLPDLGLELVGLLAAQEHSLRGEHRDVADGSDIQTHRSSLSAAL